LLNKAVLEFSAKGDFTVFEHFVKRPFHLELYRNGPYVAERSRFLAHLVQEGRCLGRLKSINWLLLEVAKHLDLGGDRRYTRGTLITVAKRWQGNRHSRSRSKRQASIAILDFVFVASNWLRYLNRFEEEKEDLPYAQFLGDFFAFLRDERGLAETTIEGHKRSLKLFLSWLNRVGVQLRDVSPKTISTYFSSEVASRWKRVTVSDHAQYLRNFFRHAGQRGWCAKGIAESIDAPPLYTYENLPQGPSWEEVQKLLASVNGPGPLQIRSRCAILFCAVYGFRIGEVSRLRLDDIDWVNEKITVRRFKQGKTQTYPFTSETGNALLRYLQEGRPKSTFREIFLTLRQPYRPITSAALGFMVGKHQKKLGLHPKRFGPHGLRHACATRLLAEGLTLKEVGSHLGHVSMAATCAYAKVDLPGLREVAALDVKPLVECIAECERTAAPFYKLGEIAALREVALIGLGGVA
jgi:site-specific recombinase XerD